MFLIFGVVFEIVWIVEEIGCFLVIFFYVIIDDVCDVLVLINKCWNIEELLGVLVVYFKVFNFEWIIFEYVMFDGVNDIDEDVYCLIDYIKCYNIFVKINLILFNEWFGVFYKWLLNNWICVFVNIVY